MGETLKALELVIQIMAFLLFFGYIIHTYLWFFTRVMIHEAAVTAERSLTFILVLCVILEVLMGV